MTTTMIDATHANVDHIPATAPKVAGYVTGTADVRWTADDWSRFPKAGRVRIEQGYVWPPPDPEGYDVIDVEPRAVLPAQVPKAVHDRITEGIEWTTVYGSDAVLLAVEQALIAAGMHYGHGWYFGHVDCWLADWNLSERAAALLLSTKVHGMTCVAVQWASPTSNPNTLVPGGSATLKQANVDLSVTSDEWFRPLASQPPVLVRQYGWLVPQPRGAARQVTSIDDGKTWR